MSTEPVPGQDTAESGDTGGGVDDTNAGVGAGTGPTAGSGPAAEAGGTDRGGARTPAAGAGGDGVDEARAASAGVPGGTGGEPESAGEPGEGGQANEGAGAAADGRTADAEAGEGGQASGGTGPEGDGQPEGGTGQPGGLGREGRPDPDAGSEEEEAGSRPSEAEAELAAQRIERERIERRKSQRQAPLASGAKLSGTAADLLAAVRAVESGEKPPATVFAGPAPAPRRPAPEPQRPPRPVPAGPDAEPAGPTPETVRAVRGVLAEGGAPEVLAPWVAALLGESADSALRADPWQLLRIAEVRPQQADAFARALLGAGAGPDDDRRGRAVTVWLLEQAALAGHTALDLPRLTATLAQHGVPDPDAAVQNALAEGEALAFQDTLEEPGGAHGTARAPGAAGESSAEGDEEEAEERPVRVLIGLERYALAEESLADGLARLAASTPRDPGTDGTKDTHGPAGPGGDPADGGGAGWERFAGSAEGAAADLIRAVAGHALVVHTGGEAALAEPAALLRAAHLLGLRVCAAAPGALGRDRFAALAGPAAPDREGPDVVTVAGLLAGTEGPGRDADGTLALDLLVVVDAPQVDVETGALLVESLSDGSRLVLAGDPGVLGSVGPGRVFADLLAARICPQVASRRPDPGPLGELVSGIGAGELGRPAAPGREIVIVPVRDAGEAVHRTVQIVADSVPRALGLAAEETQVITPGHGGAAGTRALNAALKERLNPGPGRFGGFDPGDRVVHSPAPGRAVPGRVVKGDADGLHLSCAGRSVVVPRERVERSVRHGWALTARQAAGGRWPAVVVVLPGDAARSLSRPWVYTAFGRAGRHLSVVHGVEQALPRAVAEVPEKPRTTRLPVLLAPQDPENG
ncbi:helix-hairpin-helix domain-containing protein [Streptomyces sp. NRRL F-5065]|uniref:helix-hairpin-helix domain-containing protein n=1 Tax=Streptomyces sp. NRRL F-5065 TaxID=1463855 RepID=UPI0004C28FB6